MMREPRRHDRNQRTSCTLIARHCLLLAYVATLSILLIQPASAFFLAESSHGLISGASVGKLPQKRDVPLWAIKLDGHDENRSLVKGTRGAGILLREKESLSPRASPPLKKADMFFADMSETPTTFQSAISTPQIAADLPSSSSSSSLSSLAVRNQQDKVFMLGLLWVTAFLSALDRVAMSVALVPMAAEFGLTDTVKGSISSFFSVGYGIGILPSGILLSFASPRVVMLVAVVGWSLATLATPLAAEGLVAGSTATALLVARACVGAAESLVLPALQKLLSAWTTASEKAVGLATVFTGFQAGTIVAYLLSPIVMDTFGEGDAWRQLFYVYGAFGMVLLFPWLLFAKDSPTCVNTAPLVDETEIDSKKEKFNIQNAIKVVRGAPWAEIARSKACWAMILAHGAKSWSLYNFLAWTPTFYAEQYGIGVRDSAWMSVLPCLAGAAGCLISGNLADIVLRRQKEANGGVLKDEQLTNIRKTFQGIALYGPALILGALAWKIPEDPVVAQTFLIGAVGLQSFTVAGFEAGNQEKAGSKWAGFLYSATSLPAVNFGTFGVYLVGKVLDATDQNWSWVWGINSFVAMLGATAFVTMYESKREFE